MERKFLRHLAGNGERPARRDRDRPDDIAAQCAQPGTQRHGPAALIRVRSDVADHAGDRDVHQVAIRCAAPIGGGVSGGNIRDAGARSDELLRRVEVVVAHEQRGGVGEVVEVPPMDAEFVALIELKRNHRGRLPVQRALSPAQPLRRGEEWRVHAEDGSALKRILGQPAFPVTEGDVRSVIEVYIGRDLHDGDLRQAGRLQFRDADVEMEVRGVRRDHQIAGMIRRGAVERRPQDDGFRAAIFIEQIDVPVHAQACGGEWNAERARQNPEATATQGNRDAVGASGARAELVHTAAASEGCQQARAGTQLGVHVRGDGGLRTHHGPETHFIEVAVERVAARKGVTETHDVVLAAKAQGVRAVIPGVGQPLGSSESAVDVEARRRAVIGHGDVCPAICHERAIRVGGGSAATVEAELVAADAEVKIGREMPGDERLVADEVAAGNPRLDGHQRGVRVHPRLHREVNNVRVSAVVIRASDDRRGEGTRVKRQPAAQQRDYGNEPGKEWWFHECPI